MRPPGFARRSDGKKPSRVRIPPGFALALGIAAASTSSIFIRFAQVDAPSLVIAAYRLTIASLILAPFLFRQRDSLREITTGQYKLAILSGFFLALHFATWITSLEYTNVTSSVVLVQTTPLFVAAFSPLLLGEKPSWRTLVGLLLAFTGGLVIAVSDSCTFRGELFCTPATPGGETNMILGDFLALLGGAAGAAYLMIGRRLRADLSLLFYVGLVYSSAAIFLIAAVLAFGYPFFGYPPTTYFWFLLLALIPQLLAHSTYNWALRYVPATKVSITLLGEPISAGILAYLVLGELPTPMRIAGAALVLFGVAIAVMRNEAGENPEESSPSH